VHCPLDKAHASSWLTKVNVSFTFSEPCIVIYYNLSSTCFESLLCSKHVDNYLNKLRKKSASCWSSLSKLILVLVLLFKITVLVV